MLNLRRLPPRLTVQQTVGLTSCGLPRPLGNPPANAVKYFATTDELELAGERTSSGGWQQSGQRIHALFDSFLTFKSRHLQIVIRLYSHPELR